MAFLLTTSFNMSVSPQRRKLRHGNGEILRGLDVTPNPHRYDGAIKAAADWARKNPDPCTRKTQAQKRAAKKNKPF